MAEIELEQINKGDSAPSLVDLLLTGKLNVGDWEIDGAFINKDGRVVLAAASSQTYFRNHDGRKVVSMNDSGVYIGATDLNDLGTQVILVSNTLGGIFFENLTTELIDGSADGTIAVHRDWVDNKISAILDRVIEKVNIDSDQVLGAVGVGEVVTSVEVTTSVDYIASGKIEILRGTDVLYSSAVSQNSWYRRLPEQTQGLTAEDITISFDGLTTGRVNIVMATKIASVPSGG